MEEQKVRIATCNDQSVVTVYDWDGQRIPELEGQYSEDLHRRIIDQSDDRTMYSGFPELTIEN
jgi:hypothetical protein